MRAIAALPLLALLAIWYLAGSAGKMSQPDPPLPPMTDSADFAERIGLGGAAPGSARADEPVASGANLAGLAEPPDAPSNPKRRSSQTDVKIWSAPAEFAPPDPNF
jgi:hypothetical protein